MTSNPAYKNIMLKQDRHEVIKKQADKLKMTVPEYIWYMALGHEPLEGSK